MVDDFLSLEETSLSGEVLPEDNMLKTITASPVQPRLMARQVLDEMGEESDPMRYMLSVIGNDNEPKDRRLDAAKAAAPFIYPKLAATAISETSGTSIEELLNGLPDPE